jgi:ABC-type nitrate/sulfonate/bicarbonate transport system permease component
MSTLLPTSMTAAYVGSMDRLQYNFQIPYMYVGILSITLLGLLFNQALQQVEKRFTGWKTASDGE